ncbi:MAG: hypothetical protein LZF86_110017 [Nitrospira sp.]|nr:MAG: hypothetical protein LZF86_110017 [Nitrospira sp.]
MLGAILSALPASLNAESGSSLPPPTFDVPFDEIDPAAAQTELTRHIAAFLHRLQTDWGASSESIRNTVTGDIARDEGEALVVAKHFANHRVLEGYNFRGGALIAGQYVVLQRPVNGLNEFIDYYEALKTSLTRAYGQPALDQSVWSNDLYQPLPDYWGIAVQMGHLRYQAGWNTSDGMITIALTGNHHSRLTIDYRRTLSIEPSQQT